MVKVSSNTTGNQTRIKPNRWFYVIGAGLFVLGPVLSLLFVLSTISTVTQMPSIQVVVPGGTDVTLLETGKYTIFYEYQSIVRNRVFSTGQDIPGIQVSLVSKDTGAEIPLSRTSMSTTYAMGGREGVGIFDFTIDKPGTFELSASYPSVEQQQDRPEIVLSIFHGFTDRLIGTLVTALSLFIVPSGAGLGVLVITYLKRRKVKRTGPLV
ncbi:MAG: hypothetical protein WA941_15050 [Nitrososphaeraceae archaeon]